MARLKLKNFSCIDTADVALTPLTVIIGPQASGKSVISKLFHFFVSRVAGLYQTEWPTIDEDQDFSSYIDDTIASFKKTFPPQAWGSTAFSITYEAGPAEIKIWRAKPRKNSVGNVQCSFSDLLRETFESFRKEIKAVKVQLEEKDDERGVMRNWELQWRIREAIQLRMKKTLGNDYVSNQFFIPAGRSFFTSMGKAVVAFEHGGFLDPLTISFGKYFLSMRETLSGRGFVIRGNRSQKDRKELLALQEKLTELLFSGKIMIERNEEYIEADDGRKIPFSIMSSGQQELLPLWLTLNEYLDGGVENSLVYVEEPEAHLFPLAQGVITQYIATLLNSIAGQKMLITTHSPYILAKINNLLKAGIITGTSQKKIAAEVDEIVPRQAWLKPESVSAYAIIDRKVVSIVGDDSLIDSEYLDSVSGEISRDLNRLLEIEYAR